MALREWDITADSRKINGIPNYALDVAAQLVHVTFLYLSVFLV